MKKITIFIAFLCSYIFIINTYGQKIIEGTVHSIIHNDVTPYTKVEVYYNDKLINIDTIFYDGKLKLILPDTMPYVKLKFIYPYYNENDTIIHLIDKDTILCKFSVGTRIPKYDLLFNENNAKRDILDGNIKLYIPAFVHNQKKLDRITRRYGFRYVCVLDSDIDQNLIESAYRYNNVIIEFLNTLYKKGWIDDLDKKIRKKIKSDYIYPYNIWGNL